MSKHLTIAMLSLHSCPLGKLGGRDTGGMNVYIQEIARELGRRGHKVDVFTRSHKPDHTQLMEMGNGVRLIHIETGIDEEIPKVAFYSYLQNFMCGIESFRSSNTIHYDVIHSHYWLSGLTGKQLQIWWHIPHIIMFHTLAAVKNSIGLGMDEPELRVENERELVHICDRIIAATAREKNELIQHYGASGEGISVIPCGVDLNLFKPQNKNRARLELGLDHQKVLLYVGRLEPLKGLEQLLVAISKTITPDKIRLIIIGGDDYSQDRINELQKMAAELHIQNSISFLGSVNHDKLPMFYNAADVSVIPSYYESFSLVALESLACGTPVITTDVGDLKNIIRQPEAGYIVKDNSPDLLASKIMRLLSQKSGKPEEPDKIRNLISGYGWNNIADMIQQEYDSMLNNQ
jgi:D-inositol-3-phosphate glycosyltransferase